MCDMVDIFTTGPLGRPGADGLRPARDEHWTLNRAASRRQREIGVAQHWFEVYSELYGLALGALVGLREIGAPRPEEHRVEIMVSQLSGRLRFWRLRLQAFEGGNPAL
jgi:hypothetical protein